LTTKDNSSLLVVQQYILNDRFAVTIRHKECGDVIGLVKGGLSKSPRMYCNSCDEMLGSDQVNILFVEIKTTGNDGK